MLSFGKPIQMSPFHAVSSQIYLALPLQLHSQIHLAEPVSESTGVLGAPDGPQSARLPPALHQSLQLGPLETLAVQVTAHLCKVRCPIAK